MKYSAKKQLNEFQYHSGETKGPWWYQKLTPFVQDRESVAFSLCTELDLTDKNVLDLGCGEGNLVRKFAPTAKKVVGADIAETRLKIAKKLSHQYHNVDYVSADFDDGLPFSTKSFDIVLFIGVLEYTFDPYATIKEIHRVLKPGGLLILEVPNLAYVFERLKLLVGILPSWPDAPGWQGGRLHNFTFASAISLLESENFQLIDKTGSGFLRPIRQIRPELLSGDIILAAQKK